MLIVSLLSGRFDYGVRGSQVPRSVILLSIGYGLLIALSYYINDVLLIRSDAWYHASVTREILSRGIPPMEPWLPDKPIRYMWIYHLFIASWKRLSGLPLFKSMVALNVISALSFPYLIARISAFFIEERKKIFFVSLIAVAGLESASWIAWPLIFARVFGGEVSGVVEVKRILGEVSFNGPGMIHTLAPFPTYMVNLTDKFITVTSFSYSFILFLLTFIIFISRDYLKRTTVRSTLFIGFLVLGSFLFHIVIGTALICTLIGTAAVLIILRLSRKHFNENYSLIILPAVAAAAAGIVGMPYLISLGGTETGGGNFLYEYTHFGFKSLITIMLPLGILFCPAWRAVRKIFNSERDEYFYVASWLIVMFILAIVVDLPSGTEDKLIFPLFLLLGPIIYIEILAIIAEARGKRRSILIAWVILLFAVPPVLTFRGFMDFNSDEAGISSRKQMYISNRTLFRIVEENTAPDDIVAENGFDHLAPVFSGRRNLAGEFKLARVYGYDIDYINRYLHINRNLFSKEDISEITVRELSGEEFELYLVVTDRDIRQNAYLADKFRRNSSFFKPIYSGKDGILYKFIKSME
ncbi:MAG: hypothetical protein R6U43_07085 [Candidatus Krumholzibacteriales bacterium]